MAKKRANRKIKDPNKNDKWIKIGIVVVTLIFIIIIYKIFDMVVLSNEKIDLSGENYYQYFYGVNQEYSGKMDIVETENTKQLVLEDGRTVYLDSTPIYYKDVLGKVLFAQEMELVYSSGTSYKLSEFSNIFEDSQKMYTKKVNKDKKAEINNAFLYDGNDLYFFLEETTVTVGSTKYELSPLSYVIVNYRENVEIYDYDKDEYTIIQDEKELLSDVIAENEAKNYTINMSVDSLSSPTTEQLLMTNVNNLKDFEY